MTARAEGYWWVKEEFDSSWTVAEVRQGHVYWAGDQRIQTLSRVAERGVQWGPYLGKDPRDLFIGFNEKTDGPAGHTAGG